MVPYHSKHNPYLDTTYLTNNDASSNVPYATREAELGQARGSRILTAPAHSQGQPTQYSHKYRLERDRELLVTQTRVELVCVVGDSLEMHTHRVSSCSARFWV